MSKIAPYHTDSPEYPPSHRNVYHDRDNCPAGKTIKQAHRKAGKAERPRCNDCKKLD
ncbi:hypothetical protein FBZ93_116170 [Bradyrhizobium macuxiense]|uniref:Uncharacterized protein n=1 Tax=Bradyrhizobium macuxiense TaxID=1755647 RepID=A0A560L1R5_9BRAD|nr:hypothetical protein FBZ93_116170 [Bradyrhizobium macuxiense]